MSRILKAAAAVVVVLVALFAVAQLIRPERTNPPIDSSRTLQASVGAQSGLATVVNRSCDDCHSNATVWARYSGMAPVSWLIVRGVNEGRKALNFSEWTAYSPEQRQRFLAASCRDATNGTMPVRAFLMFRPEARLSAADVQTICSATTTTSASR